METNTIITFIAFAVCLVFLAYRVSDQDDEVKRLKKRFAAGFTLMGKRPHVKKLKDLAAAFGGEPTVNSLLERNASLLRQRSALSQELQCRSSEVHRLDQSNRESIIIIKNLRTDNDNHEKRNQLQAEEIEEFKKVIKGSDHHIENLEKTITALRLARDEYYLKLDSVQKAFNFTTTRNSKQYKLLSDTLDILDSLYKEGGPVQVAFIAGEVRKHLNGSDLQEPNHEAQSKARFERLDGEQGNVRYMAVDLGGTPDREAVVTKWLEEKGEITREAYAKIKDNNRVPEYKQVTTFDVGPSGEIKPEIPAFKTAKLRRPYQQWEKADTVFVPADTDLNDKQAVAEAEIETCDCPSCQGAGSLPYGPEAVIGTCLDCEGVGKLFIVPTVVGPMKYKKSTAERYYNEKQLKVSPAKAAETIKINIDTAGIKEGIEIAKAEIIKSINTEALDILQELARAYQRNDFPVLSTAIDKKFVRLNKFLSNLSNAESDPWIKSEEMLTETLSAIIDSDMEKIKEATNQALKTVKHYLPKQEPTSRKESEQPIKKVAKKDIKPKRKPDIL